ncbi:caspase, EACC1-associated type [Amycolatopsis sp. EV170708-02-1]|uniref:caspase, EACC1-associated type n=1 Tax=Amycolatopsis sp. EV170708-02-1 TaxID=2919322 RepID=UPI001F0C3C85|nr:caspase family protein [Amycolatopsis sp. EV170708-02-1]UMP06763.1 AAA family ATPase [Amycolatopsis sp. EV170708-02-1]
MLIGNGNHAEGSSLSSVQAVRRSVDALAEVLIDRCGVDPAALRLVHDPAHPQELGSAITAAANAAESVLFVYYVGHGLVGPGNGELYLATYATDDLVEGLAYKALPYSAVRDALMRCRARSIVVVLDCCFSGRAGGAYGTAVSDAFAVAAVRGTHVLTSAARDEAALALPEESYTAFTGRLLKLLTTGDPTRGEWLSLLDAYDWLDRTLSADGLPRPRQHVSDTSGRLLLAPNAAAGAGRSVEVRTEPPADVDCPYRGMDRYGPQDSRYFFGRDNAIAELVRHLGEPALQGPVVVIGPSGSGKSSLLHAGLLPALESGALPGSSRWTSRVFTPGEHPLATLAEQQPPADEGQAVLVVDQFEEVFTACRDEDEQTGFIRALCAAADEGTRVVLGVRADFYAQCMAHPDLVPALRDNAFLVSPMTDAELRTVIEKPARAAGLELETGLADVVLRDLRAGHAEFDAGGVLPLLSYALLATWQRRAGVTLTLAGYEASGGIWESVSRRAEATYGALAPESQKVARRALLRMVRVSTGAEPTRRAVPRGELLAAGSESEVDVVRKVLDVFARDRLITVDAETATLTHESLLRAWPRFRQWIERDSADLVVHQQINDAAELWERLERDAGGLYRGRALAEADLWRESRDNEHGLTALEREFLDASSAGRRVREAEGERQRLRERKQNRRLRLLTAGLALLATVAVVASILAGQQTRAAVEQRAAAEEQQHVATARLLLSQAEAARAGDPRLALQLGIAAEKIHSDSQTRASLVGTLAGTSYAGTLNGFSDGVKLVAVSRTGLLATASTTRVPDEPSSPDAGGAAKAQAGSGPTTSAGPKTKPQGTITLWTLPATGLPRRTGSDILIDSDRVEFMVFSPDGRFLVTPGDDDQLVTVWEVSDPAKPVRRGSLDAGERTDVYAAAYSPDGRTLVAAGRQTITVWNMSSPARPVQVSRIGSTADGGIDSVAISHDSATIAAGNDKAVTLWDIGDPARPRQVGAPLAARSPIAFSPGKSLLATHDKDPKSKNQNAFVLWDLSRPAEPARIGAPLNGNNAAVAFSPDSTLVATGAFDGTTTLWDIADPATPKRTGNSLTGHTDYVLSLAFAPDGRALVTGSDDKSALLWHLAAAGRLRQTGAIAGNTDSIAFRLAGDTVVSGGTSGTVSVADLTDPARAVTRTHAISGNFAQLSPDGRMLAAGGDGKTTLWDVSDAARPVRGLTLPDSGNPAFFSPNNAMLITGDEKRSILWDVSDPGHPVKRAEDLPAIIVLVAKFTMDSKKLAISNIYDFDGEVTLWDVADPARPVQEPRRVVAGDATNVTAVAFSPDGRTLATGRADGRIILWDLSRGEPVRLGQPLAGPGEPNGNASSLSSTVSVLGMAFSPNGRLLATTNLTKTLILWDVTDRAAAHDLGAPVPIPTHAAREVAFSPDGTRLATIGFDSKAVLWDTADVVTLQDHAAESACAITGTGLDETAWPRYIPGMPYRPTCP